MSSNTRISSALFLSALLILGYGSHTDAQDADDLVSAKIGIQIYSGKKAEWARGKERVQAGDKIRLFVVPKKNAFLYVVHTDEKIAQPLLNEKLMDKCQQVTLPSPEQFYQFDGMSAAESITIISSPTRLVDVLTLLQSEQLPRSKWASTQKALMAKSEIALGEPSTGSGRQARILIGGSVRSLSDRHNTECDDISYQVTLSSSVAEACRAASNYGAANLPPGLRIDPATGLISGTLTSAAAAGSPYKVTISVPAGSGTCFAETFRWTVDDRASLTPEADELPTYSGKGLVVKTYDFTVKK